MKAIPRFKYQSFGSLPFKDAADLTSSVDSAGRARVARAAVYPNDCLIGNADHVIREWIQSRNEATRIFTRLIRPIRWSPLRSDGSELDAKEIVDPLWRDVLLE